ncbi:hypothetical protein CsSME_00016928 [Camellia sinensis var. sinensis]
MSLNCFLHFFVCLRYALDDVGSGSHVHLSLWENGKNVFMASGGHSKHGMSKVGEEFMAGVLNHLPSILAFTAPIPNRFLIFSYNFDDSCAKHVSELIEPI